MAKINLQMKEFKKVPLKFMEKLITATLQDASRSENSLTALRVVLGSRGGN